MDPSLSLPDEHDKKKRRKKKTRWNSFWRLRLFFFTLHPVLLLPLRGPALDWALQEAFKFGPWTQALCGVFSTKRWRKGKVEDKVHFSPSMLILFLSSKMFAAQYFFSWHNTSALQQLPDNNKSQKLTKRPKFYLKIKHKRRIHTHNVCVHDLNL